MVEEKRNRTRMKKNTKQNKEEVIKNGKTKEFDPRKRSNVQ
jgi:hypothetical protein